MTSPLSPPLSFLTLIGEGNLRGLHSSYVIGNRTKSTNKVTKAENVTNIVQIIPEIQLSVKLERP